MITECISMAVEGKDLSESQAAGALEEIVLGEATQAQMGSLLTALRMKGETVAEVTGAARIMRREAMRIDARATTVLDTCGTGGDAADTFNVSTTAAFIAAGAGVTVAKHGNRAITSSCGSADVLEALGVNIAAEPAIVEECIASVGIGFLFAPKLHPAMGNVAGPRREIGIRTLFNILGPMANPAGATSQLLGVYAPELTELMAGVLAALGTRRALVVHGMEGMDELSLFGESRVTEVNDGESTTYMLRAADYVDTAGTPEDIKGGSPAENAAKLQSVLDGEAGPAREIALLNAGAAIYASGLSGDLADGIATAARSLDEGAAADSLKRLVEASNR